MTLNDSLSQSVEKENIETATLNLVTAEEVPEDADCLLICSPTADLSDEETTKILSYLKRGGKAIIITDYSDREMTNLESVLEYYGVSLMDGIVLEGDADHYVQVPYYLVPDINSTEVSSDLTGGKSYTLLVAAQGIQTLENARDTLDIQSVLSTTASSYSKTDAQNMSTYQKEADDIDGPFDLGVIITEKAGSDGEEQTEEEQTEEEQTEEEQTEEEQTEEGQTEEEQAGEEQDEAETKLAVFSSSTLLDASADQMVSGGNSKLFMNTISWICGHTTSVSVPVKSMSLEYLTITSGSSSFWSIVTIGLIPAAFLITGLVIWLRRRKQ